jgi:hypothetical protein
VILPQDDASLGGTVPDGEDLMRLTVPSKDGKVSPGAFELSSSDKAQNPPRLSVFAASRTTPDQAWQIMGKKPTYSIVARLTAEQIRSIRLVSQKAEEPELDVRWDRIETSLPGADGHAGLLGLHTDKRRIYRLKLADLANEREVTLLGKPL